MLFGFVLPEYEFTEDLEAMEPTAPASVASSAESQEAISAVLTGVSKEKEHSISQKPSRKPSFC